MVVIVIFFNKLTGSTFFQKPVTAVIFIFCDDAAAGLTLKISMTVISKMRYKRLFTVDSFLNYLTFCVKILKVNCFSAKPVFPDISPVVTKIFFLYTVSVRM